MMDEIWAAAGSKIFIIGARNFTVRKVLDVAENEADRNRTVCSLKLFFVSQKIINY